MKFFTNLFIVAVICVVAGIYFLDKSFYAPSNKEEITFVINSGANTKQVAKKLYQQGAISSPLLFRIADKIFETDKQIKTGEYIIEANSSIHDILQKIKNGKVVYRSFTIPEGLTVREIFELLENEEKLTGQITIQASQGELLPETYSYSLGDTKDSIITRAKKAMTSTLEQEWLSSSQTLLSTPQEALILASIIEKETSLASERKDVAAVFANRLKKGMKLQTDPTVIYALTMGQKDLGRPLYRSDWTFDSPYNTYKIYGLPPQPICNPGKEAIHAALNPNQNDYLYFVATGKGGHYFAKDLKQHNRNVVLYKKQRAK